MANIKQQKKRVLTNENARQRNMSVKSEVKTAIKKVEAAAKAGNKEEVAKLANEAFKLIDESVSKGVQAQNTAARQKSHISKTVNSVK